MSTPEPTTSVEDWLVTMQDETKKFQKALVLRQFDRVAYDSYHLLQEYISKESKLPICEINNLNLSISSSEKHRIAFLQQPIDLYKPFPVPIYHLYPQTYASISKPHLSHRAMPLPDDHPAILCVGFIIATIQKLGYFPTTLSKSLPAGYQQIQTMSDGHKNAYIVYEICKVLIDIYGTWVNITPSIILSVMPYFLSISPISTYLITQHLLNELLQPKDDAEIDWEKMQTAFAIKNVRYRRQLYVYLIQSITLSLRLRYHTLYAPTAYPYDALIAQNLLQPDENGVQPQRKMFQNVYFNISQDQINLILHELELFTLTENNFNDYTEKSPNFPYFPSHLQQHIASIFEVVDKHQDMYEYASYAPFDILQIFGTGLSSLRPNKMSIQSSVTFSTKPPQFDPVVETSKSKLSTIDSDDDNNLDEEERLYIERFKQMLERSQQKEQDKLTDASYEKELEEITLLKHELLGIPPETSQAIIALQKRQEQDRTTPNTSHTSSPIISALAETQEASQATSGFSYLYPVAIVTGLLARPGWYLFILKCTSKALKTIFTQTISNFFFLPLFFTTLTRFLLYLPGVKFLLKMTKMSLSILYGKF